MRKIILLFISLGLIMPGVAHAASVPTPEALLQLISRSPLLAADAASADLARARLDQALSSLRPRLTGKVDGKRFSSMLPGETRDSDVRSSLELVQPVYDFGRSYSNINAARAGQAAEDQDGKIRLNNLMLEGIALWYELHASDLEVQALQEENTIGFFIASRLEEKDVVGDANPIELMDARAARDKARYVYFKARSANLGIRLRLQELTGEAFTETTLTPDVPEDPAFEVDTEKMIALVQQTYPLLQSLKSKRDAWQARARASGFFPRVEAYGKVAESTRNMRGRDDWAVGARLIVPLYDGGQGASKMAQGLAESTRLEAQIADVQRGLVRKTQMAWMGRKDARLRLSAARTAYKAGRHKLLLEQLQRSQDREASVGGATARIGHVETELVRAIGDYRIAGLHLAVLLNRPLVESFTPNFLEDLKVAE